MLVETVLFDSYSMAIVPHAKYNNRILKFTSQAVCCRVHWMDGQTPAGCPLWTSHHLHDPANTIRKVFSSSFPPSLTLPTSIFPSQLFHCFSLSLPPSFQYLLFPPLCTLFSSPLPTFLAAFLKNPEQIAFCTLTTSFPQETTFSLCLSMIPSSCFLMSWHLFRLRACTKFSKHHGVENLLFFQAL